MKIVIHTSLQRGVDERAVALSRFNGLSLKLLKRLPFFAPGESTWLKPGVNEIGT
jgi:hypothetical protein